MITCQIKKVMGGNPKYTFNFFFIDNDNWFLYDCGMKLTVYNKVSHNRIIINETI